MMRMGEPLKIGRTLLLRLHAQHPHKINAQNGNIRTNEHFTLKGNTALLLRICSMISTIKRKGNQPAMPKLYTIR